MISGNHSKMLSLMKSFYVYDLNRVEKQRVLVCLIVSNCMSVFLMENNSCCFW